LSLSVDLSKGEQPQTWPPHAYPATISQLSQSILYANPAAKLPLVGRSCEDAVTRPRKGEPLEIAPHHRSQVRHSSAAYSSFAVPKFGFTSANFAQFCSSGTRVETSD
jgi:hypothetical protein